MNESWVTAVVGKTLDAVDVRFGGGHTLVAGPPDVAVERRNGPAPLELLLAGLGTCTAITLKRYAAARGWPLDDVEVDLDIVNWRRTKGVQRILSIVGPLSHDQREALLAAAELSPVTLLLRPGLHIHTELA